MTVVFDLGNVLVELDPTWPARAGLEPEAAHAWLAQSPAYRAFECGELSEQRFLAAFAEAFDHRADESALHDAFAACVPGPLPGAVALLDALEHPVAALSNTNPIHWRAFDPSRVLRSRLSPALASHHLGARKPERAVFERASAILGTADVLFLDDNAANVEAARAFGWRAVQVFGPDEARAAIAQNTGTRSGSS